MISEELKSELRFWWEKDLPQSWGIGNFFEIAENIEEACLLYVQRNREFPNGNSYIKSAYALLENRIVIDVTGDWSLLPKKGSRVEKKRRGFTFLRKIPEEEGKEILKKLTARLPHFSKFGRI